MPSCPLVLALSLGTGACGGSVDAGHEAEFQLSPASAVRVDVARLELTDASLDMSFPGEIEAGRDALLATPSGGRVEWDMAAVEVLLAVGDL